jgi:hypothetical protein
MFAGVAIIAEAWTTPAVSDRAPVSTIRETESRYVFGFISPAIGTGALQVGADIGPDIRVAGP